MLSIRIDRKLFLKTLQIVQKSISDNKIRPVISGVYLEAKNNCITMRGTDLELTINMTLEGEILEEGVIVFKYQLIEEYLKEISEDSIQIVEQEGRILIETQYSSSEFSIFDSEEFPVIKNLEEGVEYYLKKDMFLDLMEKARIASATSPENLAVNCIRIVIEDKKLKMVASDSYRMVYCYEELEGEGIPERNIAVSVPLKTVDSLIKVLKVIDGESVNLRYEGSQVFFRIGEVSVLSRIIDLAFPDYKMILESSVFTKKVFVNTDDFISVLRRVLVFVRSNTEGKNSGIFEFIGRKLQIKGVSESAKVKEETEILKEGDDLKISLNVKFLLDYISQIKQDNTELSLNNSGSAVLLKGENEEKFIYLTMPLALREEN